MTEKMKLPSETDTAIALANYNRYLYARERGHTAFVEKATECEDFVFGKQWTSDELARMRETKRPALTINKIQPALFALLDDYLKNRVEVKFIPSTGGTPEVAQAHTKLFRHIEHAEGLRSKELDLVIDGLITSRAYYIVRIGFDDNYRGEVRISVPNPKNIIPDPDSDSYDPADWNEFIHVSYQSLIEIEFHYGKEKAELVKLLGEPIERTDLNITEQDSFAQGEKRFLNTSTGEADETLQRLYPVIERQYRKFATVPHFHNIRTDDLRRVPPHWDEEEIQRTLDNNPDLELVEEEAKVIHWTVSCGSVLLHDSASPYRSFSIIPYFPFFRRGRTSGAVESLVDPQRNYNKLRSSELHIVNGTANTGWKVKDGALVNMSVEDLERRGSTTGLVLVFKDSVDDIERIQPAMIPQGMDRISQKADSDLREISGIPDEARTLSSPQTSGKRIEAQQRATLVTATIFFENLQRTRRMLAKKVLELVQAFYSEQRQVQIIGDGVNPEIEQLELNVPQPDGRILNDLTEGEFDVVITSAPARDAHDQSQFELLARMQQDLNVPIPPHLYIEYSNLDRKDEIAAEIKRITGTGVPSEEERQMQLEEARLAMEEKRAAVAARRAQAMLSQARAEKVIAEIERMGEIDDSKFEELMRKAEEIDVKRFEAETSARMRKQALDDNMLRAAMQNDLERKRLILEIIEALDQRENQNKRGDEDGNE